MDQTKPYIAKGFILEEIEHVRAKTRMVSTTAVIERMLLFCIKDPDIIEKITGVGTKYEFVPGEPVIFQNRQYYAGKMIDRMLDLHNVNGEMVRSVSSDLVTHAPR